MVNSTFIVWIPGQVQPRVRVAGELRRLTVVRGFEDCFVVAELSDIDIVPIDALIFREIMQISNLPVGSVGEHGVLSGLRNEQLASCRPEGAQVFLRCVLFGNVSIAKEVHQDYADKAGQQDLNSQVHVIDGQAE
jgi:hypothetical protein